MINLLSYEQKHEIKAARVNVLLFRYISMVAAGIILLVAILVSTYFVLDTSRLNAQERVTETSKEVASYDNTKLLAEKFRQDLATAKAILDNEVAYSKLIYQITNSVPSGVVLGSLQLDSGTLGSQATIDASARSYTDAVRLKNAFENNTSLFSDVHLISLTSNASNAYPIQVSLSVIITKDALR